MYSADIGTKVIPVCARCMAVAILCIALAGCATSSRDRAWLNRELHERVGAGIGTGARVELPPGIDIEDGLDEAEVTSIALRRSPALRAELTRIDTARATLDEASRPANPQLSVMDSIGPVSSVATLVAPLESLWQMPARIEAAVRDADVTAETVLMTALDLVRDVRLLHLELGLAAERAAIRRELAAISAEFGRIASVRVRLGEISPMDERLLYADAQAAADASDLAETEVALARARLAAQLALDDESPPTLHATFSADEIEIPELTELVRIARAARPDARSAELAIAAAAARAGWEQSRVVSLGMLSERHWSQAGGPAQRIGGRADIPIFGANPGGIGRAEAEIERVRAQHEVVAHTIVMEVTIAHARALQATRSRERFEKGVLPALDEALAVATSSFESGDETYLVVLDVLRRAGDARVRRAELIAEQRRARCELDRAIGARLVVARNVAARSKKERETL